MAHEEKLPWDLIEEIISHVPPKSLVRFRTVSKQWNALIDDKTFINNHKSTFRFILTTKSKIYSVSIDPKIVLHELNLDIETEKPKHLVDCNEFLLCCMDKGGAMVWNPWLNRTRLINADISRPNLQINCIGYVNNNNNKRVEENVYKTIASYWDIPHTNWKIHDFASDSWKERKYGSCGNSDGDKRSNSTSHTTSCVSLNGTIYWVAFYDKTDLLYHLINFDFSTERFSLFCYLPCGTKHRRDALVLRVFKGDRFSLLKQCHETKKIEIWITKNKINSEDGNDVVWMDFMTLSVPNFPGLVQTGSYSQPSYFIDDKRLVVCSCDENGRAWIYVVEENKLMSKVQIDSVVDPWPLQCTYFPSLSPVPRGQREEV